MNWLTIQPDNSLSNADWPKQRFDMPGIKTEAELHAQLKQQGMTWAHFKTLPAYQGWLKDQERRAKP